jgi:hypothetical protein
VAISKEKLEREVSEKVVLEGKHTESERIVSEQKT